MHLGRGCPWSRLLQGNQRAGHRAPGTSRLSLPSPVYRGQGAVATTHLQLPPRPFVPCPRTASRICGRVACSVKEHKSIFLFPNGPCSHSASQRPSARCAASKGPARLQPVHEATPRRLTRFHDTRDWHPSSFWPTSEHTPRTSRTGQRLSLRDTTLEQR